MFFSFSKKSVRKWSGALALAAGLGLGGVKAQAQGPVSASVAAAPAAKYVVKNNVFNLPFKFDRENIAQVREMDLWVRDETGQWKIMDRVPPSASHFTCRVPHDGDYGFSIVTVDMRGNMSPGDVTRRPPELVVRVDGSVKAAVPATGPTMVSTEKPAMPMPEPTMPEVKSEVAKAPAPAPAPAVAAPLPKAPKTMPVTEALAPSEVPLLAPEQSEHEEVSFHEETAPSLKVSPGAQSSTPVLLLVNNTHVSIDYNINKVGPSGISKIEIYSTTDRGQTWQRLGEDSDLKSPADINLPGEGVFGIRIVGINGNGFGGKAPVAGDAPSTTLEVDLTKPKIQNWKVSPDKQGHLDIRWKVTDKNLGPMPINLYYALKAGGPWKPMAMKVKNDGSYRWPIARDLAPQYFVRLEAADVAGNVSTCDTPNAVVVDRTEPDINVIGITVVQTRPGEAAGSHHDPESPGSGD